MCTTRKEKKEEIRTRKRYTFNFETNGIRID